MVTHLHRFDQQPKMGKLLSNVIKPERSQPVRTLDPMEEGRLYRAKRRHDPEQTLTEKGLAWLADQWGERAENRFLFDPNFLWQITQEAVEDFPQHAFASRSDCRQARLDHIISRLNELHPGRVETRPKWFLNRCGGAQFSAAFLHVSAWEYVLLCGSNVGITGADSGTYATDVWDFIIEGENYNVGADPLEPVEVTRAGEYTFLGRGDRKVWSMSGPCWMIDYARGFMPLMSPFGLAENLTVSANPRALIQSGSVFFEMMLREHRIRAGLSLPRGQSRTPWGASVMGRWFGRQELREQSAPAEERNEPELKMAVDREEWAPFAVAKGFTREDLPTRSWMKNTLSTVVEVGKQRLSGLSALFRERSIDTYKQMSVRDEPMDVWASDEAFCWARLCGPGLHNLRRASEIPSALCDEDIQRATGDSNDGLAQAMEDGRLYAMDLSLLAEAELVPGRRVDGVCAWFVTTKQAPAQGLDLKAVAIALGVDPVEWVRPSEGVRWSRAKIRAQVADVTWALVYTHLAETHLYTEGFLVATRAALPGGVEGHPVRRLLDPHLEGTVFVNKMTRRFAMAEDGIVDSTLGGTRESLLGLVAKHLPRYDDQRDQRWIDEMTTDSAGIRVHPGRDDSQALLGAIQDFLGGYVERHYASDDAVRNDAALQKWATAMTEVGAQLSGAPSHFAGREELTQTLTHIVFTATVRHAAAHYSMDEFTGRVMDMPLSWRDEGEDLLSMLPTLSETLAQIDLTVVTCGVRSGQLGVYPKDWFAHDPATLRLIAKFRRALDKISADIHARNQRLEAEGLWRYETLLPERIPAGIN